MNVETLYYLSLTAICKALDPESRNIDCVEREIGDGKILKQLPKSIQRDFCKRLKRRWMCETPPSSNPRHYYDYKYLNFDQLDKFEFVMLQKHPPDCYPKFWPSETEFAHIYFDYYEFQIVHGLSKFLCRQCFLKQCTPSTDHADYDDYYFEYSKFWQQMEWKFSRCVKHYEITAADFVKGPMKHAHSWCDYCILKPLFKLYDWYECEQNTDIHSKDNSESDNIDDGYNNASTSCKTVFITDLLSNPFFD